jgi:hypothetical protein
MLLPYSPRLYRKIVYRPSDRRLPWCSYVLINVEDVSDSVGFLSDSPLNRHQRTLHRAHPTNDSPACSCCGMDCSLIVGRRPCLSSTMLRVLAFSSFIGRRCKVPALAFGIREILPLRPYPRC